MHFRHTPGVEIGFYPGSLGLSMQTPCGGCGRGGAHVICGAYAPRTGPPLQHLTAALVYAGRGYQTGLLVPLRHVLILRRRAHGAPTLLPPPRRALAPITSMHALCLLSQRTCCGDGTSVPRQ